MTAGQAHESAVFESLMASVDTPSSPWMVAGDKGYSYPRVRDWLRERGIIDVIPQRSDQRKREPKRAFSKSVYRGRNVVERCVGWLKENRRVATRYDKCAVNFMAFVTLAFIRRYLRILDPSDTA